MLLSQLICATRMMHECDGYIASSMECVEPREVVQAFSDFFAQTARKVYLLGPLLPMTRRSEVADAKQAARSPEITTFLESTLRSHGERSLLYVRVSPLGS